MNPHLAEIPWQDLARFADSVILLAVGAWLVVLSRQRVSDELPGSNITFEEAARVRDQQGRKRTIGVVMIALAIVRIGWQLLSSR